LNSVTRLGQSIKTMETAVTVEEYGQFSRCLSRIGGENKHIPAVVKLVNMMHTAGQYLGIEETGAKKEVLDLLLTLYTGLAGVIQDPAADADPLSGRSLAECQLAFGRLKARFDGRLLVSPGEMEGLKAVILSVDWEISDEILKRFDRETTILMTRLRFHRTLYPFLKIINSLGRYMAWKKAAAHKDSASFLQSVFEHFEQVAQTPALPFKVKKQLIEQDIADFNAFKKKISASGGPAPEIAVRPALSHVDAPRIRSGHSLTPLENSPGPAMPPVPASKDAGNVVSLPETRDRDVMGELFNPKESDADRLMDRIHMSLVTGQDSAAGGPDADSPEGFENLIPRRMGQDPIPEISRRLDAFFNLDTSSAGPGATDPEDFGQAFDGNLPLFEGEEEPPPDKLILMEPDEALDQAPEPLKLEKLALFDPGDDPVDAAMDRLRDLVGTPDFNPDTLAGAGKDLSLLRSVWQGDPDKCLLVDVAARLIDAAGPEAEAGRSLSDGEPEPEAGSEAESGPVASPKFWQIFGRARHAR